MKCEAFAFELDELLLDAARFPAQAMYRQRINQFVCKEDCGDRLTFDFFECAPLHALAEDCQALALPRLHRRTCFDDDVAYITKPRRLLVAQGDKHVCRQLSRACAHLNEYE